MFRLGQAEAAPLGKPVFTARPAAPGKPSFKAAAPQAKPRPAATPYQAPAPKLAAAPPAGNDGDWETF